MVELLINVARDFSSILQQERQLSTNITIEFAKILFTSINYSYANGKFQQKPGKGHGKPNYQSRCLSSFKVCSFCGKHGHILDTCYFKHGFPSGFKFKDKISSSNNVEIYDEDPYHYTHTNAHQDTKVEIKHVMCNKLVALISKREDFIKSNSHVIHTASLGFHSHYIDHANLSGK